MKERILNLIAWSIIIAVGTGIGYLMADALFHYRHN